MAETLSGRAAAAKAEADANYAARMRERSEGYRAELVKAAIEQAKEVLQTNISSLDVHPLRDDLALFTIDGLNFHLYQDNDEPWTVALHLVRTCDHEGCADENPVEDLVRSLEQLGDALARPAVHHEHKPGPELSRPAVRLPSIERRLYDIVREIALGAAMEAREI